MDCNARAIKEAKSFASGVTFVCLANSRIHNTMDFIKRVRSFPTESGLITRLTRNSPIFNVIQLRDDNDVIVKRAGLYPAIENRQPKINRKLRIRISFVDGHRFINFGQT
jgi:hypothetical protein